jgi:cell wall assembly regulator SMI1
MKVQSSAADDWQRYFDWLAANVPAAAETLNPPADEAATLELEALVGKPLPESLKIGWRMHDGQNDDAWDRGVIFGYLWLPVRGVAAEWRKWDELRKTSSEEQRRALDVSCRSHPPHAIKRRYSSSGFVPLFQRPMEGNYIGLDLEPDAAGTPGQVINFGRDEDDKFVAAPDFDSMVAWLADQALGGRASIAWSSNSKGRDILRFEHEDGDLIEALRKHAGLSN